MFSKAPKKDPLKFREVRKLNEQEEVHGIKRRDPEFTIPNYMENLVLDIQPGYRHRVARISQRSKNVMQQGIDNTNTWILEYDTKERWENPCMGWTASGDSLSNIQLEFPSRCSAICYAEKQGIKWFTEKPHKKVKAKKSYGEIFAWNKRTRTSTK
ncbi:NADH dehydrogenase [ubiquinone] iron-sulfur protein 4, mitochondrial-like [Macrosteles quadrilineatus]|uniref:NADH dehydrogenase [ubiquinone] iron-sulfur protein 4, mitochondrial-like n=1 Tax=Macrosteles quadrilineatus TaxID=74068 RepID=UPI0023E2FB53|nr:NADH dehydrogenase [ubiquinone] iron-sulfur protein 4, mitochondrial-like [Macrosteles quadrilineatus]